MQIAHRFWPEDRKLFRQRSRLRTVARGSAVVVTLLAVAAAARVWFGL